MAWDEAEKVVELRIVSGGLQLSRKVLQGSRLHSANGWRLSSKHRGFLVVLI